MTENEMEIQMDEPLVPVEEYLAAGVHIGTQQKSKDMKRFIYRVRGDGLYILDIRETDKRIKTAARFLSQYEPPKILVVTSRQYGQYPAKKFAETIGGSDGLYILDIRETDKRIKTAARFLSQYDAPKILVVTSRQYGQYPAKKFAETIGGTAATGRFIPGMLTNQNLNGYMEPEVVVVTDPIGDSQAIKEAVQSGVPIVALCDTNNMTSYTDLVIPTNNKGRKALSMVYFLLTREMLRLRNISTSLTIEDFETDL